MEGISGGARLSVARKAGFAIGDYACNLYWQSISLFLLFYYTDAVGLSATTAGLIYMVASIFDGMIDPVMGTIADRTRTRWGRYRPWVLIGALPLGLSFAALYWKPAASGLALTAVVMLSHLMFRVTYTAVSIPYASLTARITTRSDDRNGLAGFRMVFATLAGLTVAWLTQPMVGYFGQGDAAKGFFRAACVFAGISTLILPLVFLNTVEPVLPSDSQPVPRIRDYWRAIRLNKAFWLMMVAVTAAALCSTIIGKSIIYYFKYFVGNEGAARYTLSANMAAGLIIIPGWVQLTKWIGKRGVWFVASAWLMVGLIIFSLTDFRTIVSASALFLFLQAAVMGLNMTYWSMLPDTVEYGEWRSGLRAESFIFGFGIFFQKVALGLAAGLMGVAFDLVGFHANAVQTPGTLHGIRMVIAIAPAIALVVAAFAMRKHPLIRGEHERISREIFDRRAAPLPEQL
jgi:GPH family glycoside/pentoside/hexuronide:cation symporter